MSLELVPELQGAASPFERPFPDAEYERRVAAARASMAAQGLDALVITNTSNIAWLTGYDTTMPSGYSVLVLPAAGEPTFHCSGLEASCMFYSGTVTDVVEFDWHANQDTAGHLAAVVRERGWGAGRIGAELGYAETFAIGAMDAKSLLTLQRELPEATFSDATLLVLEERLIKTAQELEYMREAGRLTWIGVEAMIGAARPGATDNDVIAAAMAAMTAAGSELLSIDPMVMSGERCGWMPHLPYKRDVLKTGDPLYVEMSGAYHRYNAPCIRTMVLGDPSPEQVRVSEAGVAVLETLLREIRPGRTGHDIAQVTARELDPEAYFHSTYAYAIGMGLQPSWCENPVYIADGADRELEAGMTFHVVGGTMWMPGRPIGGGCSEAIVVTAAGCETLTPHERAELIVI
jgi:Xaa-Pro aminopeptidase